MSESWNDDVFDRIHARAPDPWSVETSAYELEKYDRTLATLPPGRFARGLEVGCSIGAQTIRLAERCDSLLALDVAHEAVRRTAARCAALPHVTVRRARVPVGWPPGVFDLIVLSEVLYFLAAADIAAAARLSLGSLSTGGVILLVNWTGYTDTPTTGDRAAELFLEVAGAASVQVRRENYRIDEVRKGVLF